VTCTSDDTAHATDDQVMRGHAARVAPKQPYNRDNGRNCVTDARERQGLQADEGLLDGWKSGRPNNDRKGGSHGG
jgi:hypothetical protein